MDEGFNNTFLDGAGAVGRRLFEAELFWPLRLFWRVRAVGDPRTNIALSRETEGKPPGRLPARCEERRAVDGADLPLLPVNRPAGITYNKTGVVAEHDGALGLGWPALQADPGPRTSPDRRSRTPKPADFSSPRPSEVSGQDLGWYFESGVPQLECPSTTGVQDIQERAATGDQYHSTAGRPPLR